MVIAIIGILAAIVIVAVGSSRARARGAQLQASAKSVQTTITAYCDENSTDIDMTSTDLTTYKLSLPSNLALTVPANTSCSGNDTWSVSLKADPKGKIEGADRNTATITANSIVYTQVEA